MPECEGFVIMGYRVTTTAEITVAGETRTVEISYYVRDDGTLSVGGLYKAVVGTIGAGKARYPTSLALFPMTADEPAHRGNLVTVGADGTRWQYNMRACVRNRPARVVGWADTAGVTNARNQTRQPAPTPPPPEVTTHEPVPRT